MQVDILTGGLSVPVNRVCIISFVVSDFFSTVGFQIKCR